MSAANSSNPKGELQELCMSRWHRSPEYKTTDIPSYPAHSKHWLCVVILPDGSTARAEHVPGTKKDAEKEAARNALLNLQKRKRRLSFETFSEPRGRHERQSAQTDDNEEPDRGGSGSGSEEDEDACKTTLRARVFQLNKSGVKARAGSSVITLTGEKFSHLVINDEMTVQFRSKK